MKKLHLALGVSNVESSVEDYSSRLEKEPDVVVPGQYALWRTQHLNMSIRKISDEAAGQLRHLGWENPEATEFTKEYDSNQILWEEFSAAQQAQEIEEAWPGTGYEPKML